MRLVLLFCAALLLRAIYLLESQSSSPFYDAPVVDALSYLELARSIASGQWSGGKAAFWQPPAFPYMLAGLVALFGDNVFTAVRVVHALLGATSVVLVYQLARRCVTESTALIGAGATALYGPLLYFEGELLSVALEVFAYLALILLMLRATERERWGDWAAAGLVAGLATITRPNVLVFVALAGAMHVARQASTAARRRAASRLLIGAAGLAIVVAPVTLRNAVVGGEFVLVSANGGVNFHIGNHAHQDSMVAIHPGIHWDRLVAEPLAAGYSSAGQRSRYFFEQGVASIIHDPLGWVEGLGHKAWQLVQGPEIKRNQDVYYARRHSRLLSVLLWDQWLSFPHGIVAPLALLGLLVSWRRSEPTWALMRLFLAGYAGSVLLFFVTSRYRTPLVPVAMIFAAVAVQHLLSAWRNGGIRQLAPPLALLVTVGVAVNVPDAPGPETDAQLQHDLAEVYLRKQQYDLVVEHSKRALKLNPGYPSAWHNVSVAQLALGQADEATRAARRAVELYPERADSRILLARCLRASGDMAAALTQLQQTVHEHTNNPDVLYAAGRLLLQMGQVNAALPHLARACDLQPTSYWMQYDLGRALHARGDDGPALAAFERAARIDPGRADAFSAAGAMALSSGDLQQARTQLQRALGADPGYLPARINLGLLEINDGRNSDGIELLRPIVESAPNPLPVWSALARAYGALGQTEKARAAMQAARALQSARR